MDLTVGKLLPGNRLREMTVSTCEFCCGSYVDGEFLKFIENKVGKSAMDMLKEKNYNQVNYLVQQSYLRVKISFTGEEFDFVTFELDIERICPALKNYVNGDIKRSIN